MRQNKEKYFNETIAYRNRNPLNIRYSKNVKWQGQEGEWKGFVRFSAFSMGYRAAVKILRSYAKRGIKTMGAIIETWAPRSENNTVAYIKAVEQFMNNCLNVNDTPSATKHLNLRNREEVVSLLLAMTKVEMGANAAQILSMRTYAEMGYDMAVTTPGFFR